ncbi:hypothetical protein CLPUN_28090 [Clostridium puniceum]|uniref:DUF4367 domain-containing protein n=1 Tax=Clostridium puniceum TaxID=29367 RepID=A0A1S8TEU5_9CLOT|nr:hypothetical protein CLPUN_28090 [Clostridium puniceum]
MSKNYKKELDKIVMSEDMKKRILHNVLNENTDIKNKSIEIKKHNLLRKNMQIIAACFTVVICLSVVKNNPQLFKYDNDNFKQKEISKDIDDKNKDLQNIEESESYYDNKNSADYNKDSQNDNKLKEQEVINGHTNNDENYKKSDSSKYNENNNENSSKIKQNEKSSEDSIGAPKTMEPPTNIIVESTNPISSDDKSKKTTKDQGELTKNNNENNEEDNLDSSDLVTCGEIIKEYKTLEEAEAAVKLKINYIKELPKGFNIDNISVISNDIIQIEYNNGNDRIIFRAGKDIENISGDYNIYKIKNNCDTNGINIDLEGNKNKIANLATWKKSTVSYSISSISGISEDIIVNMIKSSL